MRQFFWLTIEFRQTVGLASLLFLVRLGNERELFPTIATPFQTHLVGTIKRLPDLLIVSLGLPIHTRAASAR
jgi:hypothetical protein